MSYISGPNVVDAATGTGTVRASSGVLYAVHLTTTSGAGSATIRSGGASGPILATVITDGSLPGQVILPGGVAFNGELHVSAIAGTGARVEMVVG